MHTIINEYESTGTVSPLNYAAMLRAIDLLNSTTTGHNAITKIFEEQGLGNILVESAALVARMMMVGFNQALVEAFQANIDALDAMISDAEAALADAEKQLEEAKKQLEEAKAKLEATPAQLEAAKKELDAAEAELVSAEAELAAAKKELDDGEEQYKAGLEKYNTEKANAQQQLDDAKKQLDDSKAVLEDGKLQLADAEEQLKQAKIDANIQLTEGREELENAEEQIDDAQEEYQMGLEEYNKAVEEAESAIADGSKRIAGAKAQMTDIESGKWYVFDRDDMVVYYENYTDDTARIDAIAGIFPMFFLLVAALVCLTTMSRMVEEQRTQMGTYKALSYSKRSIASKFVVYSLIASIIGCILGQAICVQILPRVIAVAYQTMYKMPDLQLVIPWSSVILSTIAGLACTVLVALFCCMRELKITTAQLMRPKAPKAGKKILLEKIRPLWKVMNFSQKITARNLFRYKVRLCMTILGIGGCMALMVAGFGLQDAILPIADKQFNYICNYDAIIASTAEYNEEQAENLKEELLDDPRVSSAIVTRQMTGNTSSQNSSKAVVDVNIFVPNDPSRLTDIINTYEYKSGEILPLTDDSVLITQKMAEDLKVYAGDTFTFTYNDVDYEIPVTGVVENYVYHYVYMTPATYEKIFGKAPVYNSALIITDEEALASQGGSEQFVSDWLSQNTDFLSVTFMDSAASSLDDLMGSLNTVVLILIICAGALAFIVVYNLTNINISERVREIATIKVLGFKHREVNMYVFQENIVMSVIGILLGALGGYLMAMFMIRTVEVDMAMFVRRVEWSSYLFSALLTAFFTILVNLFMSKKMKDISMVESLKAIE